jgi:hypothetical protein
VSRISTRAGFLIELDQGPMTALAHKRTSRSAIAVSALPPKANIPASVAIKIGCRRAAFVGSGPTSPHFKNQKEKGESVRRDADDFHVAHIADYLLREFRGCQFSFDMRGVLSSIMKNANENPLSFSARNNCFCCRTARSRHACFKILFFFRKTNLNFFSSESPCRYHEPA